MKSLLLSFLLIFGLAESTLDLLDQTESYYYDPTDCTTGSNLGSYNGQVSAGLSGTNAEFIDRFHTIAEKLSIEYGIPWETVMAQGILESGSGTSNFAKNRNNFFGIAAYDSNPDAARRYNSPEEGWRGYYENIVRTKTYRAHGAFNHPGDPYKYLEAIKAAGYATDPNYISKVSNIIRAVENRAKEQGWKSSAELLKEHPEMQQAASQFQGGATYTPSSQYQSAACINTQTTTFSSNGDINDTAIALSWDNRNHSLTDPKPEYLSALHQVGLTSYGDKYVQIGASCDAFVATVLRVSGADPNVPCCGANNMLNYFASHPELYQEIPNTGSTADLQPGDIRAKPSHVEIYVMTNEGARIASASHGDRTADHAHSFYPDSAYRIFRRIK